MQIESIKKCCTVPQLRKVLDKLPADLDLTYDRILINLSPFHREMALCVFQLLVVSTRPMTIYEVAEAVVVDCEEEEFDPEYRLPDPYDIIEICSSLVTLSRFLTSLSQLMIGNTWFLLISR